MHDAKEEGYSCKVMNNDEQKGIKECKYVMNKLEICQVLVMHAVRHGAAYWGEYWWQEPSCSWDGM